MKVWRKIPTIDRSKPPNNECSLTQVEKYGSDPAERYPKLTENANRNFLNGCGGRIYPVLPEKERSRIGPSTESVQRIPASVFFRVRMWVSVSV